MAILVHGTTQYRATRIVQYGPDPDFVEPGGKQRTGAFSTHREGGPYPFGMPEEYACGKAAAFPNEGGAVIIRVDVPDDIIALAIDILYFPLSQGLVQFDEGSGLEELRNAWPNLRKEIVLVDCT